MTDQPPASEPGAAPLTPKAKSARHANRLNATLKVARDLGPYALALVIFAITAEFSLNTSAAHYADELFTLALVMIRTTNTPPPAPPAP